MKLRRIKEIGQVVSGSTPSRDKKEYWGGTIPWVAPKELNALKTPFLNDSSEKITEKGYKNCSATMLPKGSVLFSSRAPIGLVAVANLPVCTNQGFKSIVPNVDVDSLYLYYALKHHKRQLNDLGTGTTFKELSKATFEKFALPFPETLSEQRKIAHILSRAESLITARQLSLALLDDFLKSTFLDLFGDPVKNEKGWEKMRLGELADITSGVTKNARQAVENPIEVPYMRVANVQDNKLDLSEIKTIEVSHHDLEKYRLRQGDILLTEGGDPDKLGRGVVWNNEIYNCIHQNHIFRVRSYSTIEPHYLCNLIGSRYGKNYFLKAAKQTTGIASINSTQLKNFPAYVPDAKTQATFGRIVNHVETLKIQQRESLAQLQNLYQSLLQRAFAGELDVSGVKLPKQEKSANPNMALEEDILVATKPPKFRPRPPKVNPEPDSTPRPAISFWDVPGTNWQQPPMLSEQALAAILQNESVGLRVYSYYRTEEPSSTALMLVSVDEAGKPTSAGLTAVLAASGPVSFDGLRQAFAETPYEDLKKLVFEGLEQRKIVQLFDDETTLTSESRLSGRIKLTVTPTT